MNVQELLDDLKGKVAGDDVELVERAGRAAVDLFARQLMGENVDTQMAALKAIAANMTSVAVGVFEETVTDWLAKTGRALVIGALA